MYKLLLILKYLRRKLAPLFAAVAVMLCTAMVIIVLSVMGGFLNLLSDAARKLTGDVVVTSALYGFPHYEELIEEIKALPEVAAATPVVRTFGAINLGSQTNGVQVVGIRPGEFSGIVNYEDTLHWSRADVEREDRRARAERFDPEAAAMAMEVPEAYRVGISGRERPAAVIGIEVNPFHARDAAGNYSFNRSAVSGEVTLTVFPVSRAGNITAPAYETFVIVNEFKSGLFDVDAGVVFVPFETLQRMLNMEPREVTERFDPITGEGGAVTRVAGRASEVIVRAAAGYTPNQAAVAVSGAVERWRERFPDVFPPRVQTWEEVHATLLGAVKNETGLVTFLFVVISFVAVLMVGLTFYMIVLEKTRDIGVLRAIGASRLGILLLFVGYGLAIGLVGALLGLAAGTALVTHLNEFQMFTGNYLGVFTLLVGALLLGPLLGAIAAVCIGFVGQRMRFWLVRLAPAVGLALFVPAVIAVFVPGVADYLNDHIRFVMWDARTYFFDRIPDRVDPLKAGLVVLGAVAASVVGAIIPALVASSLDPVEALRYE